MNEGFYNYLPQERIIFGRPAADAVLEEAARLGARRVFLVSSKSLNAKTPVVAEVAAALGGAHAGTFDDCIQHTPRQSVIDAANAVRAAEPDLIVTLGGGTPIDTVKILQIVLAHDVHDIGGMDGLHVSVAPDGTRLVPEIKPSPVRQIIVPTTLSGAEFSNLGAATHPETKLKQAFTGPDVCARSVILDPQATIYTPDWLWLSTGIRAVDHAVEAICSVNAQPYCDGVALHALRLFKDALPRSMAAPDDLAARLTCQQAVWLASSTIMKVEYGASHGIGHVLGAAADVPHGHTSCILLPHVLAYNAAATGPQQAMIAEALGRPGAPASQVVGDLISALGQPRTLREAGVSEDQLPVIAEGAMQNLWVRTNPRPIAGPDDVMEILRAAW